MFSGAFLIPYFICLFLCGVPLFFMEVSIGQFTSRSSATMWSICPWFKGDILRFVKVNAVFRSLSTIGVGWATIAVSILCAWYFNVLLGYAVFFVTQSFTLKPLPWSSCGNWWNTELCLDYNNESIADQFSSFLKWKRNSSKDVDLNLTYQDYYANYENRSWRSPSEEYFK